jgi:hypothetical protein
MVATHGQPFNWYCDTAAQRRSNGSERCAVAWRRSKPSPRQSPGASMSTAASIASEFAVRQNDMRCVEGRRVEIVATPNIRRLMHGCEARSKDIFGLAIEPGRWNSTQN